MNPNETIGKWAVDKGLLDCWHEVKVMSDAVDAQHPFTQCEKCGKYEYERNPESLLNPDYSIYEKLAPVLDELVENHRYSFETITRSCLVSDIHPTKRVVSGNVYNHIVITSDSFVGAGVTLRDMVAELISKGEV